MPVNRRAFLALAGGSVAAVAGCATLPGECGFSITVFLSDDTTIRETAGWTIEGDLGVTFRRTEGTLESVFVAAYDDTGEELGRSFVGDLDDDDGESFENATCEGSRLREPFELTVGALPSEIRISGGVRDRQCNEDDVRVDVQKYEADTDDDRPTDFEEDWQESTWHCPGEGPTETPGTATGSGTATEATSTGTLSTDTAETPATPPPNGTVETPTRSDDG